MLRPEVVRDLDLARHGHQVTLADRDAAALSRAHDRWGVATRRADLADPPAIRALAEPADVVLGALPSVLGAAALRTLAEGLALAQAQHAVHSLLEVDVTEARARIRAFRARTGQPRQLAARRALQCGARQRGQRARGDSHRGR